MAAPRVRLDLVVLDCPDPAALAAFYARVLDWRVTSSDEDWVELRGEDGGTGMAFQLAPDHTPPTWPEDGVPQQLHLDLEVDDLEAAEAAILGAGARSTGHPRPGTPEAERDTFRVYLDPAGHPFCLVRS